MRFRSSLVVAAVLAVTVSSCRLRDASTSSPQAASPADVAEYLPLVPLSLTAWGNVVFSVRDVNDVYVLDLASRVQKMVVGGPETEETGFERYFPFDIDPEGRILVAKQDSYPTTFVKMVELSYHGYATVSVPEGDTYPAPQLSADARYYASWPSEGSQRALWIFDAERYLYDRGGGGMKDVSEYREKIYPTADDLKAFKEPSIRGATWSSDSSELAFVASEYGARAGEMRPRLKIYNVNSKVTQDLGEFNAPRRLYWPRGKYIYFQDEVGSGRWRQVSRVDRSKDASAIETVVGRRVDGNYLAFSVDGRYLSYGDSSSSVALMEIESKESVILQGASSLRFGSDNNKVVLQRVQNDSAAAQAPFWVASIADIMSLRAGGQVDLNASAAKWSEAGTAIPSFAPPSAAAKLAKVLPWKRVEAGQWFSDRVMTQISATMVNETDNYYTILMADGGASCVITNAENEDIGVSEKPTDTKIRRVVIAPGRSHTFDCMAKLRSLPAAGTPASIKMTIPGYEQLTLEQKFKLK